MHRALLTLLLLVSLPACDSSTDEAREYDLTFRATDGAFLARITFDEPEPLACDALDCNAADWRLVEGEAQNPVTLGDTNGTLRATATSGGWSFDLLPGLNDSGSAVDIGVEDDGRVTGTWTRITIAGPMPGGSVEGRVE